MTATVGASAVEQTQLQQEETQTLSGIQSCFIDFLFIPFCFLLLVLRVLRANPWVVGSHIFLACSFMPGAPPPPPKKKEGQI